VRSRPKYVGKLGQSEVAIAVGIVLREERFEDCLEGSSWRLEGGEEGRHLESIVELWVSF
jgi:hypothetical protein